LLNLGCSSNAQCNQQLLETFHQEYFYIISVKQGLFSMGFKINETTESGFKQSQ